MDLEGCSVPRVAGSGVAHPLWSALYSRVLPVSFTSARLEHVCQQRWIRSESAACDCMNRFDNGGVHRCAQPELPSHLYHIPINEFDFGSSSTADVLKHGRSDASVGRQYPGEPGVPTPAGDAVNAPPRRDRLYKHRL